MAESGTSMLASRDGRIGVSVVVSLLLLANAGFAQQATRQTAPVPLGSPFLVDGPVANPFGPPPMAIGPAPTHYPYRVDAYGNPLAPAPAYPVFAYPVSPYSVRYPTAFEGSNPGNPTYLAPDSRTVTTRRAPSPVMVTSAPIGNLQLTVSERFLNRLIARDDQKPGDVRDFILGAQVTGHQRTDTKLRLDLLPSADKVRGMLVLDGTTQSETTGVTPQAKVDVSSHQTFVAMKEVFFDGNSFTTRHAVVHVQARNQTLGATTPLSGTLFGGIADRIAYREAQRRQPAAEAIARDRVAERVYPEFDNEIDKNLALANDQLEGRVRKLLRMVDLMPSRQQTSSTDSSMSYSAQIGSESPSDSSTSLDCQTGKDEGACLLVNQSLLNVLVARTGLKGLKTTDKQIKALFAPYEYKSTADDLERSQPSIAIPGMTNVTTDIEFDADDPLTIQIVQDRALVTLRASFKPGGQDLMPALSVKIEYKTELIGDKIVVTPGKVHVALLKDDGGTDGPPIGLALVSRAIESSLTKLAFDRSLPPSLWSFGGIVPRVSAIRSQDGWAAISIE